MAQITHETLSTDLNQLTATVARPAVVKRLTEANTLNETLAFIDRAGANLDCWRIFDDVDGRDLFLASAWRFQTRAWLRIQGGVK